MTHELTGREIDLLRWLAEEEFSEYGDCDGPDLNTLCALGLAEIMDDRGDPHTRDVHLTEAGYTRARAERGRAT